MIVACGQLPTSRKPEEQYYINSGNRAMNTRAGIISQFWEIWEAMDALGLALCRMGIFEAKKRTTQQKNQA